MDSETYIVPVAITVKGKITLKANNWVEARTIVEQEIANFGVAVTIPDGFSVELPFEKCQESLGFVTIKDKTKK